MKGIDISKWNGVINWSQAKTDGVQFAILKIIDKGGSTESSFERNYTEAAAQGLPVGVYNYSYATTEAMAQTDAQKVVKVLAGRKLQCRVWLDVEDNCQKGLGRRLIDILNAYRTVIENAGYEFGVYTGLAFYDAYIRPYAAQIGCPFWIARYPSSAKMALGKDPSGNKKPVIQHPLWGWQYSSAGSVAGIGGNVDLNIMYAAADPEGGQTKLGNPYQEPAYTLYRYRPMQSREYVKWLQYELNEMGYGLAVDGVFGKGTDAAIRQAQKRYGIAADGKCGPETKKKLKSV